MATTKTTRNTKASTTKKAAPAKAAKKAPAKTKARAKNVAPPALGEALSAAASRAYQNPHVRTAGKIAIGGVIGAVLAKTAFA